MKTYMLKKEEVTKKWYMVDAEGQILGRLATEVASILRGKHKVDFTPHVDCGDMVVIINAGKIRTTGKKLQDKIYRRYSGYPGGLKKENLATLMKKKPTQAVRLAVWGMLPKNKLGRKIFKNLKVYADGKHPHMAQRPEVLKLN